MWCADPYEAVAAEVAAAQNISRGRAVAQIRCARELRERLSRIAAVFAAGDIDWRMVSIIISRTSNVADGAHAENGLGSAQPPLKTSEFQNDAQSRIHSAQLLEG